MGPIASRPFVGAHFAALIQGAILVDYGAVWGLYFIDEKVVLVVTDMTVVRK